MFSSNRNSGIFMKTTKKILYSPKTEISVQFIKISIFICNLYKQKLKQTL